MRELRERALSRCIPPTAEGAATCGDVDLRGTTVNASTRGVGLGLRALMYRPTGMRWVRKGTWATRKERATIFIVGRMPIKAPNAR